MSSELLAKLARRGIRLRRISADQLGVTGPESGVPSEAVALIRQHKAALLAALAEQSPANPPAELPAWVHPHWRRAASEAGSITWLDQVLLWPSAVYNAWEERAAKLEHEDGMSRDESRAQAYREYCQHNVTSFPTEEPGSERREA